MHDEYPSDDELRTADRIVLKDPTLPDWELLLHSGPTAAKNSFTTIAINIQSRVTGVVDAWRNRIQRLRQS
jgi:hypothetical protein